MIPVRAFATTFSLLNLIFVRAVNFRKALFFIRNSLFDNSAIVYKFRANQFIRNRLFDNNAIGYKFTTFVILNSQHNFQ